MTSTAEIMELTDLNSGNKKSKKIKDNLDQVFLTQKGLDQIKENLNRMVDAMAHNPSYISRAAAFWGELPLWQKIVAGAVLIIPIFAIAMVLQSAIFLALSIFTLITYTASSLLLDNHHNLNLNRTEHLKAGLTSLADTLGVIIISLDKLREQLAVEIEQFQLENEKLAINVKDLGEEIQELIEQRKLLQETEQALRQTNKELEKVADSLKKSLKEHTELLEQSEALLHQVQKDYKLAQSDLTDKIKELNQTRQDMGEKIETLSGVADSLQGLLQTFTDQLKLDKTQQEAFRKKIKEILSDETKSLLIIAERLSTIELKLSAEKDEYNRLNEQYRQLIERNETQVGRLERTGPTNPQQEQVSQAVALKNVGFYAVNTQHHEVTTPHQDSRLAAHH
ncbi:LegC2/C7 family Dot/Icm T4SS effector [Legionella fallonii]|uniref:Inclusion membrane protein A n=1 Tax=Legionella fallonii LLAP-10 TaxID=1212491 RepID=A0A098G6B2_9GAMM|nr:LegC2/C7 family Dot/Icm T4SS effector [Legionella fallonii]CEG57516.1 conserved protein of unknown function [Legionella fallonii LLAP-10]